MPSDEIMILRRPLLKTIFALFAVYLAVTVYNNVFVAPLTQPRGPQIQVPGAATPHSASWKTWFHPLQAQPNATRESSEEWNLFQHLGGNGPWIEKSGSNAELSIAPPEGCSVDQVHMVSVFQLIYVLFSLKIYRYRDMESGTRHHQQASVCQS